MTLTPNFTAEDILPSYTIFCERKKGKKLAFLITISVLVFSSLNPKFMFRKCVFVLSIFGISVS